MRITAPVSNNKHHPKCYPLPDRFWSHKITCFGSGVLRLHPIALTMAIDFRTGAAKLLHTTGRGQTRLKQHPSAMESAGSVREAKHCPCCRTRQHSPLFSPLHHKVSAKWPSKKILPHARSGNNSDLSYTSKTYLHLRKHRILRWKCTCGVLSYSVSLHLWPISDTYRACNKTNKQKIEVELKKNVHVWTPAGKWQKTEI